MNNKRNLNLDIMRLFGVFTIMIAHASPPDWLFQLRNFGTPLLIIASALTYAVIYSKRNLDLFPFYKKRLTRLIIPAWIFLSVFFFTFFVLSILLNTKFPFSIHQIAGSYTFYLGIDFVWILKVYIILALITPLALTLNRRIESNFVYFSLLSMAYILYEFLVFLILPLLHRPLLGIFNNIIFIIAPYSILYFYGFRLSSLSDTQIRRIIFVSFTIFATFAIYKYVSVGQFVSTQTAKYPPRLYYLSYGFFATNAIYLMIKKLPPLNETASQIVTWLSSNSLWIYLWHIMAFYIWAFTMGDTKGNFVFFVIKTLFLLGFGVIFTALQKELVNKTIPKNHPLGREVSALLT